MLAPYAGAALPDVAISPSDRFMLIFTSGTTGAPKAVMMSQGRLCGWGNALATNFGLSPDDVCYSVMPLFHSNAAVAGFTNIVASGAVAVLRRRFSASGWLDDVRKYGVTFFNYVGKPLTYILATPERPDDAENPLNFAFGNEAAPLDIDRFAQRFGCIVVDGYGSTEGGANMSKSIDTPPGALGKPVAANVDVRIFDPETMRRVPAREVRRDGPVRQRRGSDRRDGERQGLGRVRGLLQQRRSQRRTHARRHVLDRRPRLPRRRRVLLLRGPQLRLAPRRRRELRGRAGRERAGASPVRRAVRGVRGARGRRRRRRDGRAPPARRARRSTRTSSSRSSTQQADLSPKWVPRYVRISVGLPSTATQKVLEARAAPRALGNRRRRCGGDPGGSASSGRSPPRTRPSCARSSRRGAATTCSDERERGECRVLVLLAPRRRRPCRTARAAGSRVSCVAAERACTRRRASANASTIAAAVERAFGRVQQRVRREDLVERARELDVVADDRRAADRHAAPGRGPRAPRRSPRLVCSADDLRRALHEARLRRTPSAARRGRRNAPAPPERARGPTCATRSGPAADRDDHRPAGLGEASERAGCDRHRARMPRDPDGPRQGSRD